MRESVSVAIVGASGYAGAELIEILLRHRFAKIQALYGSERMREEPAIAQLHPRFRNRLNLRVLPLNPESLLESGVKFVFLATPHELSEELVPLLIEKNLRVVDLSGAFRLPSAQRKFDAVYGLTEWCGPELARAQLVSNPGCYPTSILLALKPLIEKGYIDFSAPIIADSISGISGAGRQVKPDLHFSEVSARAYGIFNHRHAPEISHHLDPKASKFPLVFVPHVAPYDRGILSTIHARVREAVNEEELRTTIRSRYEGRAFVRVLSRGEWPAVKDVVGTNFCDIGLAFDSSTRQLVLVSAIDNLLKGAAGQAVQNFNLLCGYQETEGLLP